MKCYVYKSLRKEDTFLYLGEKDRFDLLPEGLQLLFGKPGFVLEFELTKDRALAQADAKKVLADLHEQGYYLQVPLQDHEPS